MAKFERCGNEYDRSFDIVMDGERHTFDSFECAVSTLAPECAHCGCRVLGHGVQAGERIYCCAHCARASGIEGIEDRVPAAAGTS